MKKLLAVIDMQKDFVDGSLGSNEAVAIVPKVVEKIKQYMEDASTIIFTKDTHFENYMDTMEGKNLPVPHCIKGTSGHELCKEIKELGIEEKCTVYEKNTFGSKELAADLAAGKYNDYDEIELVGLCTDICVISNAMLFKTYLLETNIKVDAAACAGASVRGHEVALLAMKACQIEVCND